MSFYTDGIKTHIIDPIFNQANFQSEFRLNSDSVYLSNLRLLNIGVTTAGGAKDYNLLVGAYGVIQSIQLYDGNELLDQLLEQQIWQAFSNYNHHNNKNADVNRYLACNGLGFVFTGPKTDSADPHIESFLAQPKTASAAKDSNRGWLDLKRILPFLDSSMYLPTNIFKRLRLVITYTSNADVISQASADTTSSLQPLLVADEVVGKSASKMMSSYKGVEYEPIEHDRVIVDEIATTTQDATPVQQVTFTVNGYDGKQINRILVVKTPSAKSADSVGLLGSIAQKDEKVQLRINGGNIFAQNGITRPNQRLALLTDSWGTCNSYPGSNLTNVANASNNITVPIGQLDYFGCVLNQKVNEMQIDFSRTGQHDGGGNNLYNQRLALNIYCEVRKAVIVGKGGYNVVYV